MKRFYGTVLIAAMIPIGCSTVARPIVGGAPDYSAVPEPSLREFADYVEEVVRDGNRDAEIAPPAGIRLENESVRQAIRTRAARAELIDALLDTGHAWEKRNGLIAILRTAEYKTSRNRRQKDRDALVVMGENQDRWTLYEGLVKDNDWPSKALNAVQAIFADARIAHLEDSQKFEGADGPARK